MVTRTLKKDAEKGWSADGKTAGQRWIQENTLDPIDGCQVVYRDGNKDEHINITFSLLFRPYLGFHWEPEAFFSDYTFKKRLSGKLLISKQTDALNDRGVNQVKLKFLFHFASSAPSIEKSLAVGLDVVHSADLGIPTLNLSMFGLSPHCYWSHQTCWPDPAQVIQQVQSEQVFSLKPFYSFRSEAVPGRSPEGNGRLLLAWANNIMRVQRASVCLCVCSCDFFHVFCLKCLRVICAEWSLMSTDVWLCLVRWMAAFMFLLLGFWRRVELEKKTWPAGNPALLWSQQTPGRSFVCLCVFTE